MERTVQLNRNINTANNDLLRLFILNNTAKQIIQSNNTNTSISHYTVQIHKYKPTNHTTLYANTFAIRKIS